MASANQCPECGHPIQYETNRCRPSGLPTERAEWCTNCDWGTTVDLDAERRETLELASKTAGDIAAALGRDRAEGGTVRLARALAGGDL